MNNLKRLLMSEARSKGICADGYNVMRHISNNGEMVDYYLANPDWCLERDFPSLAFLKEHALDYESKGVFVGRKFVGETLNDLQTYIFHKCTGAIKVGLNVEKGIIPMLYFANGCHLNVVGVGDIIPGKECGRSVVPIYSFGENDVSAPDNMYVKFTRYKTELI